MARHSFASRKYDRLTERELVDGFGKLVANEWRAAEARPFIRRMKSVPSISAPYLINAMVLGDQKERETATSLLGLLAGPRVIVPLRDVMKNTTASGDARIAAAMVLEGIGEPVNVAALIDELNDPMGMFESVWGTVIDRAMGDEAFLSTLLKCIEDSPKAEREELIRSLAEPGDPRIMCLLRPLLYSKRVGTILAAIDAIESIGGPTGLTSLNEIAEGDPSPQVRQRARAAYGRLHMRDHSFFPDLDGGIQVKASSKHLPLHRSWATLLDGKGNQAVLLAFRQTGGSLKVISTILSETAGMKNCVGIETMTIGELADIEEELIDEGLVPVAIDPALCVALMEEARGRSLQLRQRIPIQYEIWKNMLGDLIGQGLYSTPIEISPEEETTLLSLLPDTETLMARPEFRQWIFESSLVWPYVDEWSYLPVRQQDGQAGRDALDRLVNVALVDLMDEDYRTVLSRRLHRQAWLLEGLDDGSLSRLSRAAAVGLDPTKGVPLELHPFARAMVIASFFNAGLRVRQPGLTGLGWPVRNAE